MEEFNITEYVRGIQQSLKATSGYEFCRVSDPKAMEEVIQNSKRCDRFFALDDSQEGMIFQGDSGGWFEHRSVVVFLLGKLSKWPDMTGRERILNEMRNIYRKIVSRLIRDREHYEALAYLADDSIPFDEIPGEFAGGTAGLFFTFTVDIPLNLEFNGADWK